MSNTGTRVPEEVLEQAVHLYKKHDKDTKAAYAEMGVSKASFYRYLRYAAERGLLGYDPVLPGFEVYRTSTQFDKFDNVKARSVKQRKETGDQFELPIGHVIKGVSALTDAEGRIVNQWVKTKADDQTPYFIEAVKAAFNDYTGRCELIPVPEYTDADLLSVYPIADQHHGLLAWGREVGESYDLKVGASRLRGTMQRLVAQAPRAKHAIILNLGDWQHTDDQRNVTPASGNQLDTDSRYFKILTTGIQLMQDCIELALQRHETVLVRNIPGNHDPHSSMALTVALCAFYANNPRVKIDDDPGAFFFHRFGETLLGATHGHNMKPDRMAMMLAVYCREDWGRTKYHWFLYGHHHQENVKEIGDVRVECFQSLASRDAFSHEHGFVSGKSLTSITLHRQEGEVGRHRINICPASLGAT